MSRDEVRGALRLFLVRDLGVHADLLHDETPLLESGLIDSIGVISLVAFCEETFDCVIPVEEIEPDVFASVSAIAEAVVARWRKE